MTFAISTLNALQKMHRGPQVTPTASSKQWQKYRLQHNIVTTSLDTAMAAKSIEPSVTQRSSIEAVQNCFWTNALPEVCDPKHVVSLGV